MLISLNNSKIVLVAFLTLSSILLTNCAGKTEIAEDESSKTNTGDSSNPSNGSGNNNSTPSTLPPFCADKSSLTAYNALGSGTANDPYLICTSAQLNDIGLNTSSWSKNYKLMDNIDLTGVTFNQIGIYNITTQVGTAFTGIFDGNGYTISNLNLTNATASKPTGMFIYALNAQIKKLALNNVNVSGQEYTGALVGFFIDSTISNVSVSGAIAGKDYTGGIVGLNKSINGSNLITDSHSSANVTGTGAGTVGGIAGLNEAAISAKIQRCYSTGSVTGPDNVGGLVGYNFGWYGGGVAEISDSFSSGHVSVTGSTAGGITGVNLNGIVNRTVSLGLVTGGTDAGGVIGCESDGTYNNNYYNVSLAGQASGSFGCAGITATGNTGLTESQLKQASNFSGWDFNLVWLISEGVSFPQLR